MSHLCNFAKKLPYLFQPGELDLPRTGQVLLSKARKITRATADMASVHGKLAPSLQLSSEEALSFQVKTPCLSAKLPIEQHSKYPTLSRPKSRTDQ